MQLARRLLELAGRRNLMSDEGSGSTSIVAIFAIILMLGIAGFIAWRAGMFGGGSGGDDRKTLDINVNTK